MHKIISLYQRNYDGDRLVRDEIVPGAEWVIRGEGVATRKLDGTCCQVRNGKLHKRLDVKPGKVPPVDFEEAQHDEVTGKRFGWVPVGDGPEDKWHREAWNNGKNVLDEPWEDGTYELVGPKIQGNPEKTTIHHLWFHGMERLRGVPRDFEGLKQWLSEHDIEGIVWHHPDGCMVKIKAKDFGLKR